MKKLLIKSVSLVLILIMSALMLFSCGKSDDYPKENGQSASSFPPGWTGGFHQEYGNNIEYWWIETYEELMVALETLKLHGSTFEESVILNYNGDLFDVKHCIVIPLNAKGTENIKFGDNPFDRKAIDVSIMSYCFFDEISIDELNYSYVERFDACRVFLKKAGREFYLENNCFPLEKMWGEIDCACLDSVHESNCKLRYKIFYEKSTLEFIELGYSIENYSRNDEVVDAVLSSLEIISGTTNNQIIYPEGYIGGLGVRHGYATEYWWVETYDEMIAAVELLKSHGSTFEDFPMFVYEGDLFDTKYCFAITTEANQADEITLDDNPFDRRAENVRISSYAFFDEVSIEELNYSDLRQYDAYCIREHNKVEFSKDDDEMKSFDQWSIKWDEEDLCYKIYESNKVKFVIESVSFARKIKKESECVEKILKYLMYTSLFNK